MNLIFAGVAIFALLFGTVLGTAFADDKANSDATQTAQQKSSPGQKQNCANDLDSVKRMLDDASNKAVALKEKLYSEWKSQYSTGQTKDDWGVYAKKLEASQEMQEYRQIQEKYNSVVAICGNNSPQKPPEPTVQFTPSAECTSAQQMVNDLDRKYSALKQKAYDDWKSQNAAGTYLGSWDQFANDFINSQQVTELNQARQKYEPVLRTCYAQSNSAASQSTSHVSQNQSCPDAERVRSALSDASQKVGALKEQLSLEWKALYHSGQTKDGWDVYAKKKLDSSQEYINYQQLQQKLDLVSKTCKTTNTNPQPADNPKPVNPEPKVQFVQSSECIDAQKAVDGIDQKYSALKQKAYDDWKSQNTAGTYPGSWGQYADENLIKLTEVIELNKMREKYDSVLRTCYVQSNVVQSDMSQTKQLPAASVVQKQSPSISQAKPKTDQKQPVTTPQTKSKIEQKQYGAADSAKKSPIPTTNLTKAKQPDKIIKKPARQLVQK